MKIRNESNFTPAPEGVHGAVCVDAIDNGMVDGMFGPKHKLTLVWQIDENMDSGKPFLVSKRYSASIHPKSTLRKDLKSWRGKDFTDEEAKEFDLESVVGSQAQLVIQHNEHEGTVYANVLAITKGKTKLSPRDYVRKKDREGYVPPPMGVEKLGKSPIKDKPEDSDIPF